MKTAILLFIGPALAGGIAIFVLMRSNSDDPRKILARNLVDALAADNWDRSAIEPYLCGDRRKIRGGTGISFDQYKNYDGIKAVGKVKLISVASPPDIAMDTFIPVLFKQTFAPFAGLPNHFAHHAAYIQLQTQKTSDGKACLEGWGRNDIPLDPHQSEDFLNYRGIFDHD